jgi:hypothetical protein
VAVKTSARKSKREKRLFKLNVPTAISTSPPNEEKRTLVVHALEVKEARWAKSHSSFGRAKRTAPMLPGYTGRKG